MRPVRLLLASILSLAAAAASAPAEPVTLEIDPSHSQVAFSVRHFFSKVPGRFNEFEGKIQFDDKDASKSLVEVTIKTASIDTHNERRDNHLRSADFFAADSFPTITFKSTKVTPGAEGKMKIDGDLMIRGISRAVTLDASFLGSGSMGPMGKIAGWEANTTINRKDFNVLWDRVLDQGGTMLGDDVAITIGIEAKTPRPAGASAGTPPPKK